MLAQVGLLTWPVELSVTLDLGIQKTWKQAAGDDASTPKATTQRRDEKNAPRPQSNSETPATAAAKETAASDAPSQETPTKNNSDAPALTIARISPNGPSVFGGTAAPFSQVTVLDGSTRVGTATANDRGDWSIVTEYQFANSSPNISLRAEANPENAAATASEPPKTAPPPPSPTASSHETPATQLLKKFEGVVAAARDEAKHQIPGAPSAGVSEQGGSANVQPSHPPESQASQSSITQPLLSPSSPPAQSASQPPSSQLSATTVPVPITFVYNEATLTPEGRSAAGLLLEFLKLKKFASVILSGHADERGLPDYNMELSHERLIAIERVLRNGGYQGKLQLVPKGATEPFTGVDRSKYPAEELYQLDRRVELRVAN